MFQRPKVVPPRSSTWSGYTATSRPTVANDVATIRRKLSASVIVMIAVGLGTATFILTQERFAGPEWIFEQKFDGIRLLANFTRWAEALSAGMGAQFSPVGAGGTGGGD